MNSAACNSRFAQTKKIVAGVCRYVLAALFLFSGFVKAVDPMGGAIKLGEYAAAVSLFLPEFIYVLCSVALSAFEMALGAALLLRVGRRMVVNVTLILMIFFTILTLMVALWNPVADCGCFGDAIKLSNWGTFYKNLIFLFFAILLFALDNDRIDRDVRVDITLMLLFFCMSSMLSGYSLYHLPPIDFMPYKVGLNIGESMQDGGEVKTTLVYRDKLNQSLVEFALTDTTWYDTVRYEYVDTKIEQASNSQFIDFSLYAQDENITEQIINEDRVVLVILASEDDVLRRCMRKVSRLLKQAEKNDYHSYVVSSNISVPSISIRDHQLEVLYMDPVTKSMLLRASSGVVVLDKGTIVAKWNCRDIPPRFIKRLRIKR